MNSYLNAILSIPKTVFYNFKLFDLKDAVRFPLLVSYKCRLKGLKKGSLLIDSTQRTFAMVRIGFGGSHGVSAGSSEIILAGGVLKIKGSAVFSEGTNIRNNGSITIGNNFCANKNFRLSCGDKVTIGQDCLFGWNCTIRDSNGHDVYFNGEKLPNNKPVKIGNHCWCGSESHILRGTTLQDNTVVGYGSIVSKQFQENNICVAGNPAKIIKNNIEWED